MVPATDRTKDDQDNSPQAITGCTFQQSRSFLPSLCGDVQAGVKDTDNVDRIKKLLPCG